MSERRFRKLTMFVLICLCLFQINLNLFNVNYLLDIKIETKNLAPTVGFEPETFAVPNQLIARCT